MSIQFYKYQGTGNDFVIIDNRDKQIKKSDTELIKNLCDRRFGVGADGLILLQDKKGFDFEMVYFNADGLEGSMCGNGGRCITAFAKKLGIIESKCYFNAIDGPHESIVKENDWVELRMTDVPEVEIGDGFYVMDTGSPHYIIFVEDIDDINVVENGQAIRYSKRFRSEGINVNFVEQQANELLVATYERGVEDETFSCGTGVTAAAIAHLLKNKPEQNEVDIVSKGGKLRVRLQKNNKDGFEKIWLCGKANLVFVGTIQNLTITDQGDSL